MPWFAYSQCKDILSLPAPPHSIRRRDLAILVYVGPAVHFSEAIEEKKKKKKWLMHDGNAVQW